MNNCSLCKKVILNEQAYEINCYFGDSITKFISDEECDNFIYESKQIDIICKECTFNLDYFDLHIGKKKYSLKLNDVLRKKSNFNLNDSATYHPIVCLEKIYVMENGYEIQDTYIIDAVDSKLKDLDTDVHFHLKHIAL